MCVFKEKFVETPERTAAQLIFELKNNLVMFLFVYRNE